MRTFIGATAVISILALGLAARWCSKQPTSHDPCPAKRTEGACSEAG
jgi:hypothetical protein